MTEKKPPHADGTHTTTTSHEVDATGTEGHGTHTTVRDEEVKVAEPKVESSDTKEDEDPAEDPDIQNTVA